MIGFAMVSLWFCRSRSGLRGAARSLELEFDTKKVSEMDSTRRERIKNGSGSCLTRRERGERSPSPPSISGRFPLTAAFGGGRVLLHAQPTVGLSDRFQNTAEVNIMDIAIYSSINLYAHLAFLMEIRPIQACRTVTFFQNFYFVWGFP